MADMCWSFCRGPSALERPTNEANYRDLFRHANYESADFELVDKAYAKTCDLTSIPAEDERFDFIVVNQTLEHVPEPGVARLHRELKPGGRIICTAPLVYEEHEQPYVIYRYTQFAYRHLRTKTGHRLAGGYWEPLRTNRKPSQYLPVRPRDVYPGWGGFAFSYFWWLEGDLRIDRCSVVPHRHARALQEGRFS